MSRAAKKLPKDPGLYAEYPETQHTPEIDGPRLAAAMLALADYLVRFCGQKGMDHIEACAHCKNAARRIRETVRRYAKP